MTDFYLSCLGLCLLAISFIFVPLKRQISGLEQSAQRLNRLSLIGLPLLMISAAFSMYYYWGAYQPLKNYLHKQAELPAVAKVKLQLGSPQAIAAKLQARLQQAPNDAQGWFWLGRLYLGMQRFEEAAQVLAKADQLNPQQPDILLAYVQAVFLTEQKLSQPAAEKLEKLLQMQPNNITALNLKALAAFQRKDYAIAIEAWEKILSLLPPESEDAKTVLEAIAKAQKLVK